MGAISLFGAILQEAQELLRRNRILIPPIGFDRGHCDVRRQQVANRCQSTNHQPIPVAVQGNPQAIKLSLKLGQARGRNGAGCSTVVNDGSPVVLEVDTVKAVLSAIQTESRDVFAGYANCRRSRTWLEWRYSHFAEGDTKPPSAH